MSTATLSEDQIRKLKEAVLIEKIAYLCDDVGDPGRYFPELRSKSILGTMDTDSIRSKTSDREKMEEFVNLISKRRDINGRHAFDVFVDALQSQRVHAHVARTLLRAFKKKKAEAQRTTTPSSVPNVPSPQVTAPPPYPGNAQPITPTSNGERSGTTSSQHDVHPVHGLLPPNMPPPSASDHTEPDSTEGDIHPQYGLKPNPPPASANNTGFVAPQQADMSHRPHPSSAPNGHYDGYRDPSLFSDELGGQSMTYTDSSLSTLSTLDTNYSTDDFVRNKGVHSHASSHASSATSSTGRNSYPSLGSIDDPPSDFEKWRKEKKNLEYQLQLARDRIHFLEIENMKLKEQLFQHRPSNLPFGGQQYNQFSGGADYSLSVPMGPPSRQRHPSPSPGPVGERETPGIRSAISSGSLNFQNSRGNLFSPSESRV